jgi:hypothetical protein
MLRRATEEPWRFRAQPAGRRFGWHGNRRTGDRARAEEHLATATAMYRDMGMDFWLEKAEAELGGVERRRA